MNKLNLIRLKKYGLVAEITSTEGGHAHLQLNLPSGQRTGFGAPPNLFEADKFSAATAHLNDADRLRFFESDPSCAIAAEVLDTFAKYNQKVQATVKNGSLSPQGRADIIVVAATDALTAIATQYAALEKIGNAVDAQEAVLYAAPALDAVSVAIDVEIRAELRDMAAADYLEIITKLDNNERILHALVRNPLPMTPRDADIVKAAWLAKVATDQPEAVASYTIARDNFEWANGLVKYLAGFIANASTSGSNGTIDKFALYKIAAPLGVTELFDITSDESKWFERKLAQAAA